MSERRTEPSGSRTVRPADCPAGGHPELETASAARTVREPDVLTVEAFDQAVDALTARLHAPSSRPPPAAVVVALVVQIGYLADDDRADLMRLLVEDELARELASAE